MKLRAGLIIVGTGETNHLKSKKVKKKKLGEHLASNYIN